jgi:ABC-type antimicrobial peptide transport system permease subunit
MTEAGRTVAAPRRSLRSRLVAAGFDSSDDDALPDAAGTAQASSSAPPTNRVIAFVSFIALTVHTFLKLNGQDIKARKGTYCLGVASCFIVVLITAMMVTVMGRLPLVFMRLAELEEGEADLKLVPGGQAVHAQSLNYTRVLSLPQFQPPRQVSFHAPRMIFDPSYAGIVVRNLDDCKRSDGLPFNPIDPESFAELWVPNPVFNTSGASSRRMTIGQYLAGNGSSGAESCSFETGCAEQYCNGRTRESPSLYALSFAREARMQLGRGWPWPSPGAGNCIMHQDLARRLGQVTVGDTVLVELDAATVVLQAFENAELDDLPEFPYSSWGRVLMPLTIANLVTSTDGKLSADSNDFIFVDYETILTSFAVFLNPAMPAQNRRMFAETDPHDLASEITFEFPPSERKDVYSQTDDKDVLASATAFATPIIATLGFNQVDVSMPIVSYIQANRFFSLFLGLILSLIILGLGFLCIVLIHSLLTVGVETRTFELGIMRMVGMTRGMLSGYVVTGALLFAIPAWALGLIIAQLIFLGVVNLLSSGLGVEIDQALTPDAIGYATLVGLFMPLLSTVYPIMSVLALDLPSALNTSRSKTKAIQYDINHGGAYHLNWTAAGIGLAMAVVGFLIYYLFPLALITFNITLLFYILFGILMGMLFGLVLLVNSFEGLVELGSMYVFLFWESAAVFQLIKKNLIAHRLRNRKTALMFAMSIGFLIFVSVAASIQIESVIYATERSYGATLLVRAKARDADMSYAAIAACETELATLQAARFPGLRWTYLTNGLAKQIGLSNATTTTIGRYAEVNPFMAAVAPNFYDVVSSRYLLVDGRRDTHWGLSESLYGLEGSGRLIVSTKQKTTMSLDDYDELYVAEVKIDRGNSTDTLRRLVQSEAFLDAGPVAVFSQYTLASTSALMSLPSLVAQGQNAMHSVEQVRYLRFIVDVPGGKAEASSVAYRLQQALTKAGQAGDGIEVRNIYDQRSQLDIAVIVLNALFGFAQIMATFICYFALSSSMSTNIHEQAKEIGVLRCIGFRKTPLTRTYVWEAFLLVFSSSLLGIVVGVVMGYTIVLQRALFTQLPLPFVFPYIQLGIVLILSFLLALLSSFAPIRALLRSRSVTTIMRKAL